MTILSTNEKKKTDEKSSVIPRKAFFLVLALTFIVNLDSTIVIPLISNYAVSLGATIPIAAFIVGVYSMVHIPANIVSGRLVDRFGRKTLIAIGLGLDAFSIFLYSIAPDWQFLLFARVFHGLGGGFGGPGTMAYLSDATPKEKSGRGMAYYGISFGIALLVGFMIGGMVTDIIGYSNLFRIIAIVLVVMILISLLLPKIYQSPTEKLPIKDEINIFKDIITSRKLLSPYLATLALNINLGIITATYSVLLREEAGYSSGSIGMIFSILVAVSIAIQYPIGSFGDKRGKAMIMNIGLFFVSITFLILMLGYDYYISIIAMIIFGIGHGIIFPTSTGIIKDNTEKENYGIATGTFYAMTVAGIAIGSPIAGIILEQFGLLIMLIFGILVPLIAVIIFLLFLRNRN